MHAPRTGPDNKSKVAGSRSCLLYLGPGLKTSSNPLGQVLTSHGDVCEIFESTLNYQDATATIDSRILLPDILLRDGRVPRSAFQSFAADER
jgi:hypothetical protein